MRGESEGRGSERREGEGEGSEGRESEGERREGEGRRGRVEQTGETVKGSRGEVRWKQKWCVIGKTSLVKIKIL